MIDILRTSNHERAPVSAAFVKAMREVFGEVKVLYVKEGDFEIGETKPRPEAVEKVGP